MSRKKEVTRIIVFLILILFSLNCAYAYTEVISCADAELSSASKYTVPSDEQDIDYGSLLNTATRDSSCSASTCWGTGINDPANATGNEIYQEFLFDISQTEIKEFVFNFDSCWGGGQDGCGHDDHPEFLETSPGQAQAEIYGSSWTSMGSSINLGHISASSAMQLSSYSKRLNFTNNFVDNNSQTKVRIKTTGEFFGTAYDVEMYTDYANLEVCYVSDKIYEINLTVKDNGNAVDTEVEVTDGENDIYSDTAQTHTIDTSKKYTIKIKPENNAIKELQIKPNTLQDAAYTIEIANPQSNDWVQAYAVDATELNANTTITATAAGDQLYKCDDWNFGEQSCDSSWSKIMSLTIGQDYTVAANGASCFKERENYDISKIEKQGVTNLVVVADNASIEITDTFTGVKKLEFKNGDDDLFYFMHDFDDSDINLSQIKIIITSNAFVIDLAGQEADGSTKAMYFKDANYATLCVKNAPINSPSDISAKCDGNNEIKFDECIDNSYGLTKSGVTCYDEGKRFRVENLSYSGIMGKKKTPKQTTSGGGGGGSSSSGSCACSDGEDNDLDGFVDYPDDPGCDFEWDRNEYNSETAEEAQQVQTQMPSNTFIETSAEPLEIITGSAAVEPEQDRTPLQEEEIPLETVTSTKKSIKRPYGSLTIFALLISLLVVYFLVKRDGRDIYY